MRHDPSKAFAELAQITVNIDAPEQTLRRVAELAKQTLGGVDDRARDLKSATGHLPCADGS